MNDNKTFQSPWQKERLHDVLDEKERLVQLKMRNMAWRNYRTKFSKDRLAGPTKNVKGSAGGGGAAAAAAGGAAKKADPDKK
jgi:hypothetical protein